MFVCVCAYIYQSVDRSINEFINLNGTKQKYTKYIYQIISINMRNKRKNINQ